MLSAMRDQSRRLCPIRTREVCSGSCTQRTRLTTRRSDHLPGNMSAIRARCSYRFDAVGCGAILLITSWKHSRHCRQRIEATYEGRNPAIANTNRSKCNDAHFGDGAAQVRRRAFPRTRLRAAYPDQPYRTNTWNACRPNAKLAVRVASSNVCL
jgi:hypothetical protein